MLQKIRDKTQGWFAAMIIGAVCVTFALWGIHYYLQGVTGKPDYAAKVNGKAISLADFNITYRQAAQQQAEALGGMDNNTPALQKALRVDVMKELIEQKLLTTSLFKQGYRISAADIEQFIVNMPQFQENGQFSQTRFNQIMQTMMYSQSQFYSQLQNQLLIGQLAVGLSNSNYALPTDVKAAVMLLNETRDIGFVVLPLSSFVTQVNVTEAQIATYYKQHQVRFKTPEQIQLQYLQLPADTKGKNTDKSDLLANLTYENPDSLEIASEKLGLPLMTTTFFEANAPKNTGILASKSVMAVAFSNDVLNEGYNSDVITLDDGSQVVIRVLSRKPASVMPLSSVQEIIKNLLIKQTAQDNMKTLGEQLAQKIAKGASGTVIANELKLNWHEKTDVNRHQQGVNPQVLLSVFKMYVSADRQHPTTQTILLPNGNLAVVAFYQAHYGDLKTATAEQLQMFNRKIADDYGNVDYALYVRSLKKQAKIKINQSLINDNNDMEAP
ncbi:MAG: hypothetical protein HKM04_02250 [Legionellales bacterium]|nr:hypothetical protein [Legionellales bacterium]